MARNTKTKDVKWGRNSPSGICNGVKMSDIVCGMMAHTQK